MTWILEEALGPKPDDVPFAVAGAIATLFTFVFGFFTPASVRHLTRPSPCSLPTAVLSKDT